MLMKYVIQRTDGEWFIEVRTRAGTARNHQDATQFETLADAESVLSKCGVPEEWKIVPFKNQNE